MSRFKIEMWPWVIIPRWIEIRVTSQRYIVTLVKNWSGSTIHVELWPGSYFNRNYNQSTPCVLTHEGIRIQQRTRAQNSTAKEGLNTTNFDWMLTSGIQWREPNSCYFILGAIYKSWAKRKGGLWLFQHNASKWRRWRNIWRHNWKYPTFDSDVSVKYCTILFSKLLAQNQ